MTISEFEKKWVNKINFELLKSFPNDFIESDEFEIFNLPGKTLLKGSELFSAYEIIDIDGVPLLTTVNLDKVKYILYANLTKPNNIKMPKDELEIRQMVKSYERHLDEILKMIIHDFKLEFPFSEKHVSVSSKIFKLLNLHRY